MRRIKYFDTEEFACRCGCGFDEISDELEAALELAREFAGIPLIVNSGCRCVEHNARVGGSPTSSHLKGLAADIECRGMENRWRIVNGLMMADIPRIIIYPTFVHVDVDYTKHHPRIAVQGWDF